MFQARAAFQKFPSQGAQVPERPFKRPSGQLSLCPLTEGLISEIHHAALVTAVVTSGINTFYGPANPISSGALDQYASQDLTLLHHLKTMSLETLNRADDLYSLSAFLAELGQSQQAYRRFASDVPVIAEHRAIIVHRHGLTSMWQRTCRAALPALQELEGVAASALTERNLQNHHVLSALLKSAAQGFRPCLDENGQLYLPPLPQKRRWPRLSVLQTCFLEFGTRRKLAFIRDVSAGGMGLDQIPKVALGTELTVEMESGRRLTGTVIWTRASSAGLKFFKPLLPSDPLISG
jgi:PilZ domain